MRTLCLFLSLLLTSGLFGALAFDADEMAMRLQDDPGRLKINNRVVASINGKTISTMDVMKKMEVHLQRAFPQLNLIDRARYEFFRANFRDALAEMIDRELIFTDAKAKKVEATDGDAREELENLFGPNIMVNIDKLGLTYDEAFSMIKQDLTIERMIYFMVSSKTQQEITPLEIRAAYRDYVKEHTMPKTWTYRVITHHPDGTKERSEPFMRTEKDCSTAHAAILAQLLPHTESSPFEQQTKSGDTVTRTLFLEDFHDLLVPQLASVEKEIKAHLMESKTATATIRYMARLRNQYKVNHDVALPEDFVPFEIIY